MRRASRSWDALSLFFSGLFFVKVISTTVYEGPHETFCRVPPLDFSYATVNWVEKNFRFQQVFLGVGIGTHLILQYPLAIKGRIPDGPKYSTEDFKTILKKSLVSYQCKKDKVNHESFRQVFIDKPTSQTV